jgi:hypothetical protein
MSEQSYWLGSFPTQPAGPTFEFIITSSVRLSAANGERRLNQSLIPGLFGFSEVKGNPEQMDTF